MPSTGDFTKPPLLSQLAAQIGVLHKVANELTLAAAPGHPLPPGVLAYLGDDKALTQIELPGTSIRLTGALGNLIYK